MREILRRNVRGEERKKGRNKGESKCELERKRGCEKVGSRNEKGLIDDNMQS